MSDFIDDSLWFSLSINIILIVKALIDLFKSLADNRLQIREKDEELKAKDRLIERLKSQKEKISKDYFKLKESL